MKPRKPIVIQVLEERLSGLSVDEAVSLIDNYFSQIVWDYEKGEWDQMTDTQRKTFAEMAVKQTKS